MAYMGITLYGLNSVSGGGTGFNFVPPSLPMLAWRGKKLLWRGKLLEWNKG